MPTTEIWKWAAPVVAACALALSLGGVEIFAQGRTTVSIQGDRFLINGSVTHAGTPAEGLLLNSRMAQAVFDDENATTVVNWRYPDTGTWSAERNVTEFIAALPLYASRGLRAVSVNLQGGNPGWAWIDNQPGVITAFNSNGTIKAAWLDRLDRVIRAADQNGIVVILGLFYFGQDHRLADEAAIIRATDGVTDWLVAQGFTNVLVEVNNEADYYYNHAILQPARVSELITRVKQRSAGKLKVSTSLQGKAIPSSTIVTASDYVLLHGNGASASQVASMVDQVRAMSAWQAKPKPIVFNEDSPTIANLDAAVSKRASWGYHENGKSNYWDGYQSPPINWTINTTTKQAFFNRVASLTATSTTPIGETKVTSFSLINADTNQPISGYDVLTGGSVTLNLAQLPTRNLNLRANTSPSLVGSVRFGLNGNANYRIENGSPYSLAGDASGDYAAWQLGLGTHAVTATSFSGANATGTAGTPLMLGITITDDASAPADTTPPAVNLTFATSTGQGEVKATDASPIARVEVRLDGAKLAEGTSVPLPFTVQLGALAAGQHILEALVTDVPGNVGKATTTFTVEATAPPPSDELRVTSFTLINADTDQPIGGFEVLTGGTVTLNLAQLPTRNLNLRANTSPSVVGSVRFGVNGTATYSMENGAPYALAGDNPVGDYQPWTLQPGSHTVTGTPYSGSNGSGTAGAALIVSLAIVDQGAPKPPTNVRIVH